MENEFLKQITKVLEGTDKLSNGKTKSLQVMRGLIRKRLDLELDIITILKQLEKAVTQELKARGYP